MGKHEAPSPAKKRSSGTPKHAAAPVEKEGLRFSMPELKLPKLPNFSDLSLPKLPKLPKLNLFQKQDEDIDDYEEDDDEELDENDYDYVKPYDRATVKPSFGRKAARENPPAEQAPAEPVPSSVIIEPSVAGEVTAVVDTEISIEEIPEETADESVVIDENPSDDLDDDITEDVEEEEETEKKNGFQLPKIDFGRVRAFFEKVAEFGVNDQSGSRKKRRSYAFNREQVFLTAGAAVLFFLIWLMPTIGWVRFLLYLIPFIVLGAFTVQDAVAEVLDGVIPGRNLLMSVAAVGMLILGDPRAAVFVMLIHRVFLLLEAYLYEMRESRLEQIEALIPNAAVIETESGLERVKPEDLTPGDVLFVPAGDIVALDGVILEGISSLDTSALCGKGATLDVGVNSRVYAGCRNLTNPLRIRVTNAASDSTVARCVNRVRQAAESKASRASLVEYILSYVPMGLAILGLLIGLVVSLATGDWRIWLYRGFLLIALAGCGDALLSARYAYFTGIVDAFKDGISFLSDDVIDRFATTDMMIFSKTGTVTEGKYSVVAVYPVEYEEKDLLTIAALAECQSVHPIAVALRDACGIDIHHRSDITLLEETPGRGIHTLFGGRNVYVGNSSLLLDHNIVFEVPSHKGTVIHVAVDNKYAGCIVLNDRVRENAFDAIEELRLRGVRATVMLTGDVRSMARPVASSLSFDMVKCELNNEAKQDSLNYLRESKGNAAAISYVSSKDEDVEILKEADVGVGFAALSQYRLIGEAAVVLMDSRIFQIPQALFLAKRISIAALIVMIVMLGLEALLVILGLCGFISVWVALLLILLAKVGTLVYSVYFK